jgi:nucleoside-diphosphate-sugar epimerase
VSKVYFITGAGRGMGVDFARAALAAGHQVVATGRRPEAVVAAAGSHENLLAVTLDITNPAQAGAAVADYAERTAQIVPAWERMNGTQSGDPARLARALVTLLDAPTPPERWVAGADAVQGVTRKAAVLRQQASAFPELSTTLDHA